jgi:hypothetical protein
MKKREVILAIVLGIIALGISTSCEEIDGLFEDIGVTITSDFYEMEFAIPPAPSGIPVILQITMETDIKEIAAAKGYPDATINYVRVQDAIMEVSEKSNVPNLNAIDTLGISISNNLLNEKNIAYVKNNLPDAGSLPMETPNIDISDYLESVTYNLTNYTMLKETPADTLWVKGKIRYKIRLTIANISE